MARGSVQRRLMQVSPVLVLLIGQFIELNPAAAAEQTIRRTRPLPESVYSTGVGIAAPLKSQIHPVADRKPVSERRAVTVTPTAVEPQETQTVERGQPVAERSFYRDQPLDQPVVRVHDAVRNGRRTEVTLPPGKGNEVFFRGGYVSSFSDRAGEIFTDNRTGVNPADKGYYVGAGLDLQLTCDTWGLLNGVSVLGEIDVQFSRFNSHGNTTAAVSGSPAKIQVTMLTVSISPKIKFNGGHAFQPWIIPVGVDFLVISPPSNQGQYLDIGAQFGAGAEYQVWKEFKIGFDARYHLSSNQTQTVNSYWTVGPYVGIGF
jgi:hypothetical protein